MILPTISSLVRRPASLMCISCRAGPRQREAALKMARQYFIETGEPERKYFIARRQSYHGNTLGALAVGGNPWRRDPFAPLLIETHHVAPCYEYRERRPDETAENYGRRLAAELEARFHDLGPENVIAFVAETVVGATAGALMPVPGYFKRVREVCDRHGVLLILDEVMCGMGRTGTLHACEQEEISPDLMAIAEGVGWRLRADRRRPGPGQNFPGVCDWLGAVPARTYLHGPPLELRRCFGSPASDRARRSAR